MLISRERAIYCCIFITTIDCIHGVFKNISYSDDDLINVSMMNVFRDATALSCLELLTILTLILWQCYKVDNFLM